MEGRENVGRCKGISGLSAVSAFLVSAQKCMLSAQFLGRLLVLLHEGIMAARARRGEQKGV